MSGEVAVSHILRTALISLFMTWGASLVMAAGTIEPVLGDAPAPKRPASPHCLAELASREVTLSDDVGLQRGRELQIVIRASSGHAVLGAMQLAAEAVACGLDHPTAFGKWKTLRSFKPDDLRREDARWFAERWRGVAPEFKSASAAILVNGVDYTVTWNGDFVELAAKEGPAPRFTAQAASWQKGGPTARDFVVQFCDNTGDQLARLCEGARGEEKRRDGRP